MIRIRGYYPPSLFQSLDTLVISIALFVHFEITFEISIALKLEHHAHAPNQRMQFYH